MTTTKTVYQEHFETHWTAVLGIFRYLITQFADESVEIAARAVALAAPLPNAINMYNVAIGDLGWSPLAAFAFSLTLEIVVFLLVEIALLMWDGYILNPHRYRIPFAASVVIVSMAVAVVIGIVAVLETHKIMAFLPVISLCAFAGIGLKRWHERSEKTVELNSLTELNEAQTELNGVQAELGLVRTEFARLQEESDRKSAEYEQLHAQFEQLTSESDPLKILSELDERKQSDIKSVVRIVEDNRITGPADLLPLSDLGKSKIYSLWPLAITSRVIYKNGDNSYHAAIAL